MLHFAAAFQQPISIMRQVKAEMASVLRAFVGVLDGYDGWCLRRLGQEHEEGRMGCCGVGEVAPRYRPSTASFANRDAMRDKGHDSPLTSDTPGGFPATLPQELALSCQPQRFGLARRKLSKLEPTLC